ncbi:MAG: tRNA pseudouridine(55) synthase TruB [Alphaproteobacteria bacterium]
MDGWIIIDKPTGIFSRTCAAKIGRMIDTKKFGHIGTLDPMASGVLPIAFGNATKMIPFVEDISDGKKEYTFSMQFGFETDTLDITGTTITQDDFIPDDKDINSVLSGFIGKKQQIPPMYSAVHINGQRAYNIARQGKNIDVPPRNIEIFDLEFLGKTDKSWNFRVVCSRGTYVRSLARDIAKKMNAIATVDSIHRTQTNGFRIENAIKLDFLENLFNNGHSIKDYLMPTDFVLGDIPVINLDDESAIFYKNGGFIRRTEPDGIFRIYTQNTFIGIGTVKDNSLRPKRTI